MKCFAYLCMSIVLSLVCAGARAMTTCELVAQGEPALQFPLQTFPAGAHIAVGTRLTPFATLDMRQVWQCSRTDSSGQILFVLAEFPESTGISYMEGGMTYTVFRTNLPGVGIIFRYSIWDGEKWVTELPGPEAGMVADHSLIGPLRPSELFSDNDFGFRISAAFVKTGAETTGTIELGGLRFLAHLWLEGSTYPFERQMHFPLGQGTTFIESTCDMQDIDVVLPSISAQTLHGPGDTAGSVDFQLDLMNCPSGYSVISYQIDAAPGLRFDTSQGVLGLTEEPSSAHGLGIQIRTPSDAALHLGQRHAIETYRMATGGDLKVPLRAAYFQMTPRVTPGLVSSAAIVTLWYQ